MEPNFPDTLFNLKSKFVGGASRLLQTKLYEDKSAQVHTCTISWHIIPYRYVSSIAVSNWSSPRLPQLPSTTLLSTSKILFRPTDNTVLCTPINCDRVLHPYFSDILQSHHFPLCTSFAILPSTYLNHQDTPFYNISFIFALLCFLSPHLAFIPSPCCILR
jgi:hypothetical protein